MLQRAPILESLRSDNRQDAVRRLAIAWLLNCPTKNEEYPPAKDEHHFEHAGLAEALPLPLAVIGGEGPYKRTQPSTRALRACSSSDNLARAEHVDRIEPLLTDATNCNRRCSNCPGRPAVQVRDVALVVLLQLTGQRPADYGYVNARLQPRSCTNCNRCTARTISSASRRLPNGSNGGRERAKSTITAPVRPARNVEDTQTVHA